MLKNYTTLAFRNIARKKLYTAINLAGLGIASAFCILVYWYVQNEISFDRFHKNVSLLYRIEISKVVPKVSKGKKGISDFFSFITNKDQAENQVVTPPVMAIELQKNFPEIEYAVRYELAYEKKVRVNNQSFVENRNVAYVDKDFFNAFSFPLSEGNPATALEGHNNIVISEKAAIKYFGNTNAVGKTIVLPDDDSASFVVSGVVRDFPVNSSFQFDVIIPRTSAPYYNEDIEAGFNTSKDQLFVQLKAGVNAQLFQQKLNNFSQTLYNKWLKQPGMAASDNYYVCMRPFAEAHYMEKSIGKHFTNVKNIYQLIALTFVFLIIACLNYILLTLTQSISRSGEVGVRKTIGAERKQIIFQLYVETQWLSLIAVAVGFVLAVISLPLFSDLTGTELQLSFFSFKNVALTLLLLAFVLGALAGVYPALVMSGLKPLSMMRRFATYRLSPYLSKSLMIVQYSVCVVLIIATLVINRQMHFINHKDLGFDKAQVLTISNPYDDPQKTDQLKDRLAYFASSEPSVEAFTSSFLGYFNTNAHLINSERIMVEAFDVDYNYFSFFKIPVIEGRGFSADFAEDSALINLAEGQYMEGASRARQSVVVNETLYNMLGKPKLNEINPSLGGRIIGVCKDYYPDDLTKKIAPAYHRIARNAPAYFSFRIKANQNIPQVMNKIKAGWSALTGNEPFSYTFLDETLSRNYEAYIRWMKVMTVASVLSIIIACMGLFGLSGLTAAGRVKEIGIRKVFGASIWRLFLLLNKGAFATAIISFAIAVPFAIYLSGEWLQNFAYRIQLNWTLFVIAGVISMITAMLAVSYHTIKAAKANPVKTLRNE